VEGTGCYGAALARLLRDQAQAVLQVNRPDRQARRRRGRSDPPDAKITTLDTQLDRLVAKAAPGLLARFGVGPDSAGALLGGPGQPDRLRWHQPTVTPWRGGSSKASPQGGHPPPQATRELWLASTGKL